MAAKKQESGVGSQEPAAPVIQRAIPVIAHPQWPAQSDVATYFGKIEIGENGKPTDRWERSFLTSIEPPYPMRFPLSWEGVAGQPVRRIVCHKSVAKTLNAILGEIFRLYGNDPGKVRAAKMDLYGGCYVFRPKRSGKSLSMHSYGIAIDLDPDTNSYGRPWKDGTGMMPAEVVDIFEAAGWSWGGLWKTGDAMHFQATQAV